jgi:hypothetical protein
MDKIIVLMLLLLPKGLRLIFGHYVNVCIYLPSFYPMWTAWSLFSAKTPCNLSARPFVLHFHLVIERSAFFNDYTNLMTF